MTFSKKCPLPFRATTFWTDNWRQRQLFFHAITGTRMLNRLKMHRFVFALSHTKLRFARSIAVLKKIARIHITNFLSDPNHP